MSSSLIKAKIFTSLALLILTVSFTFPMIAFHGTLNKVDAGRSDEVSSLTATVWNIYNQGRYKSVATPDEAENDLFKMIDTASEIGVASLPIWAVSLEAPNYPKEAFPEGIPVYFHFDGF
ncbi:MAG: cytochrome C, partial [Helicobacteraceae bacterium]|nr:cytochrome C [Helicobacteraceae bacterium]